METQEQEQGQPAVQQPVQQPVKPGGAAAQFQETIAKLGQLTISLVQQREELAERERQRAALDAEIAQRRLRLEDDERELLRVQGAAGALQTLVQADGKGAQDAA